MLIHNNNNSIVTFVFQNYILWTCYYIYFHLNSKYDVQHWLTAISLWKASSTIRNLFRKGSLSPPCYLHYCFSIVILDTLNPRHSQEYYNATEERYKKLKCLAPFDENINNFSAHLISKKHRCVTCPPLYG